MLFGSWRFLRFGLLVKHPRFHTKTRGWASCRTPALIRYGRKTALPPHQLGRGGLPVVKLQAAQVLIAQYINDIIGHLPVLCKKCFRQGKEKKNLARVTGVSWEKGRKRSCCEIVDSLFWTAPVPFVTAAFRKSLLPVLRGQHKNLPETARILRQRPSRHFHAPAGMVGEDVDPSAAFFEQQAFGQISILAVTRNGSENAAGSPAGEREKRVRTAR